MTELLAPFFAILRSPLSTGPITSASLSALHSFFVCGLIIPTSRCLDPALVELSSTLSHCKFEASDSSGDEVVLLKIITVIQDCFSDPIGFGLGDIEVCEMLETVLTTCCQMRLSGMLLGCCSSIQKVDTQTFRNSPALCGNGNAYTGQNCFLEIEETGT